MLLQQDWLQIEFLTTQRNHYLLYELGNCEIGLIENIFT